MIASGKGGVGKTMIVAALGTALAERGHGCCCIDLDIGLRDLDMAMNLHDQVVYDVLDVAQKECRLKNALLKHSAVEKLTLLPASQLGTAEDLTGADMKRMVKKIKKRVCYVLMDAPAGIEHGFQNGLQAMDQSILVTTADDMAIRNAERVIGILADAQKPKPMLIVNRIIPQMVARGTMYAPQTVAEVLDIPLLGYVPEDLAITKSMHDGESFMHHKGPAQQAMLRITDRFLGKHVPMPPIGIKKPFFTFWKR